MAVFACLVHVQCRPWRQLRKCVWRRQCRWKMRSGRRSCFPSRPWWTMHVALSRPALVVMLEALEGSRGENLPDTGTGTINTKLAHTSSYREAWVFTWCTWGAVHEGEACFARPHIPPRFTAPMSLALYQYIGTFSCLGPPLLAGGAPMMVLAMRAAGTVHVMASSSTNRQ